MKTLVISGVEPLQLIVVRKPGASSSRGMRPLLFQRVNKIRPTERLVFYTSQTQISREVNLGSCCKEQHGSLCRNIFLPANPDAIRRIRVCGVAISMQEVTTLD